jgi:hypothetical protein
VLSSVLYNTPPSCGPVVDIADIADIADVADAADIPAAAAVRGGEGVKR